MEFSRIKVLMLGWEFPPIVAGGLGAATYGLAKALAPFTDLTIILPRSDAAFKMNRVNIIGLNHFVYNEERGELILKNAKEFFSREIYSDEEWQNLPDEIGIGFQGTTMPPGQIRFLLNENDLYGIHVQDKVQVYAEMMNVFSEKLSFDIIHAHDWITYPAAICLKQKTGKPLLVHVHSLETDRSNVNVRNAIYEIEKNGMTTADRVLPVSAYTKDQIINYYRIPAEKIFPVYNAVEGGDIFQQPRNDEEKRVLFLGRITRQKGPEYLLETMKMLCGKMQHVKFLVAGTGDKAEELKEQVASAGLSERVHFTGFIKREKIPELLASVDAYFMPSVSEPFGLSALEAAQFNVPCVISKQSGVSEVLHNVLKADYWDIDRMANYLYAVLHYDGLRKEMTRLTTIDLQNISWDSSAREVLKSYKHLLNDEL